MYSKDFTVRWADVDANQHMRHSAYNDYAAQTRLLFMAENGYGMEWFKEHNVFPVLLREETVFMKEINSCEPFRIDVRLLKMSPDGSRWSMVNQFFKSNELLATRLTVDGAWMDIVTRKLLPPPLALIRLFSKLEKCEDFEIIKR